MKKIIEIIDLIKLRLRLYKLNKLRNEKIKELGFLSFSLGEESELKQELKDKKLEVSRLTIDLAEIQGSFDSSFNSLKRDLFKKEEEEIIPEENVEKEKEEGKLVSIDKIKVITEMTSKEEENIVEEKTREDVKRQLDSLNKVDNEDVLEEGALSYKDGRVEHFTISIDDGVEETIEDETIEDEIVEDEIVEDEVIEDEAERLITQINEENVKFNTKDGKAIKKRLEELGYNKDINYEKNKKTNEWEIYHHPKQK